jgi:NIMA (never in mitosis gene a)-related kinase 7
MEVEGAGSASIYGSAENFVVEEKKLGQGQFSVVYRALCKADNRPVALKKVQVGVGAWKCSSMHRL